MTIPNPVQVYGAPGSPYTRKMLAYLRFRRIPYALLVGEEAREGLPKPRVGLLPTLYLPSPEGALEAVTDSTPLIRRIEAEVTGREVLPHDPVLRFLDELIEDYGDEWLTKAMFHYRWYYEPDIDKGGEILPRWRGISTAEEQIQQLKTMIQERQISRLYVVGSNDETAAFIEDSYRRFLRVFDELLREQPFSLGRRPSSGDLAIYGQLTQLAQFDPTPMEVTFEESPRVYAWVDIVDDLSGLEPEPSHWLSREELRPRLEGLLSEIGRVYAPFLIANAEALDRGDGVLETVIDGERWVQKPFPYQAKCLRALHTSYARLDGEDREVVDSVLAGTGTDELFAAID